MIQNVFVRILLRATVVYEKKKLKLSQIKIIHLQQIADNETTTTIMIEFSQAVRKRANSIFLNGFENWG
jgi:hypothetical protein